MRECIKSENSLRTHREREREAHKNNVILLTIELMQMRQMRVLSIEQFSLWINLLHRAIRMIIQQSLYMIYLHPEMVKMNE